MKQPKIMLFGDVWDVIKIEFHEETGELNSIIYQYHNGESNLIVQSKQVDYGSGPVPLKNPIVHPNEGFVVAPNLNDLFVREGVVGM